MSRRAINLILVFGFSFFLFPPLIQGQVTFTVNDGSGYRGSHNNPVEVSLSNTGDTVKRVQVDVCDVDDYLNVLDCAVSDRCRDGFTCQVVPLPSGCARVIVSSPGGLIEQGTGDIFTLKYNVDTGAPGGQGRALDPVNVFITDEFGAGLTITPPPVSGNFTFENCSAGTQCEDGLFCNGAEGCSGGVCTHTGDPCPGSECGTCQECTDSCFDPEGTPCTDDGLYCNGDEICNGSGSCGPAGSPCPNATCVEIDDQCTCNLPGESCDDGNFCNGGDFCLFGVCEHTGDPCPSQGLHCDTLLDRCICLIDAECDDENVCTDESCAADGSCRYLDNTDPCDDGIYCNGADTCDCGTCNHSGDPCSSPLVCDEGAEQCNTNQVEVRVGSGNGVIGSIDRVVNIQLKNPSYEVTGISMEVCDENDYLIANSCLLEPAFEADFDCSVIELENGCALVGVFPSGINPITFSSSFRNILTIDYDVGLCVERGTPGDVNDCGTECFQAGSSCTASTPDCYRFDRNKSPNCQPPPAFTCYALNDPCLPVDTGAVPLTIENLTVVDTGSIPLLALPSSAQSPTFTISCDGDTDCDGGSVCSIDTCSGGSCQHTPSGLTVCDDGVYCTETDRCEGVECIGEGDTCGSIFFCDETDDQCISCFDDSDCDGVPDGSDNCVGTPNGPDAGVCTAGASGEPCLESCDCALSNGYCSLTQEDSYPPVGNNLGDACDCEGNFDCDADVDGSDAQLFKTDFGRSTFLNPCTSVSPCNGDLDCDGDVDGTDARVFKDDFGRSTFQNPCPPCVVGPWCCYP